MTLKERLTEAQQKQIDTEQKRYDASVAQARKDGQKFDPLNDAPTEGRFDPAVQQVVNKIWSDKKTNG